MSISATESASCAKSIDTVERLKVAAPCPAPVAASDKKRLQMESNHSLRSYIRYQHTLYPEENQHKREPDVLAAYKEMQLPIGPFFAVSSLFILAQGAPPLSRTESLFRQAIGSDGHPSILTNVSSLTL